MANKTMGKTTSSSWWNERHKILASMTKPKPARVRAKPKNVKARKAAKAKPKNVKAKKVSKIKKSVKKVSKTKR